MSTTEASKLREQKKIFTRKHEAVLCPDYLSSGYGKHTMYNGYGKHYSGLRSLELVDFLTSSASSDRLREISSSTDYPTSFTWQRIFADRKQSESQASRLKLEKLSLKNIPPYQDKLKLLDPRIIDLIDLSIKSLIVLVLDKIAAPSDYLLWLITNCTQLQQLQFSFMLRCRCEKIPCVHSTSSKQLLEAIPQMESLDSLKIGLIEMRQCFSDRDRVVYLDIEADLPVLIDHLGRRGRLVEFGLLHNDYCSNEVVVGIGQHLTGLKSLELNIPYRSPATLIDMIKKMVNLEKLAIRGIGITLEIPTVVASHLQNLRSFHLWWMHDIGYLNVLTRMERLEELTIRHPYVQNIKWKSAFGRQLQSLELWECQKLVPVILKKVPGLRRLVLDCRCVIDKEDILRMIAKTCPGLRELHMIPANWLLPERHEEWCSSSHRRMPGFGDFALLETSACQDDPDQ